MKLANDMLRKLSTNDAAREKQFRRKELPPGSFTALLSSVREAIQPLLMDLPAAQPNFQTISKEHDYCATIKKDRSMANCCKITGHRCIKGAGKANCMKTCKRGVPCSVLSEEMTFDVKERKTMFCFRVYTENTGSTKPSYMMDFYKSCSMRIPKQ